MIASFIQVFIESFQRAIGPAEEGLGDLSMVGIASVSFLFTHDPADCWQYNASDDRCQGCPVRIPSLWVMLIAMKMGVVLPDAFLRSPSISSRREE